MESQGEEKRRQKQLSQKSTKGDEDVLLDQQQIRKAESYRTIKRLLERNGYTRHPEKYFTFVKTILLEGIAYDVDVDFLSGRYGGDGGHVSKHREA